MSYASLEEAVADDVSIGCCDASKSLGIVQMPEGFALMLNPDRTHYYYLSATQESCIHWNKWAIYRWAKAEYLRIKGIHP
jgi:hypothetical protein